MILLYPIFTEWNGISYLSLEVEGLEDHAADGLDADLVGLVHRQDNGFDLLVIPDYPNEQLGQIQGINKLS